MAQTLRPSEDVRFAHIGILRALHQPYPQGWVGSVSRDAIFDFAISRGSACGPFTDEREFNDWRISTLSKWEEKHLPTVEQLQQLRAAMLDNHKVAFTHGGIARYNILVSVGGENNHITALLDWELAGWRPEYWEAHKFVAGAGDGDWADLGRRQVVPGYDAELKRENQLVLISGIP